MCTGKLSQYNLVPNAEPLKYCCSVSYDILTIIVSIADVTTDIIVLINFYEKERMTFFTLSLIVLILAQCSYAMAFSVRFDTVDEFGFFLSCCLFCCLLPFGSLVAFCIYLADDECLDIGHSTIFSTNYNDSDFTKWIKTKLNKHIGFILEALIEAFPQSLIQITAIVYYQEANIISIISILISMASVMSKSLILSQGVEATTFIWSWLCAVTDFFGIFFTLTWVFYSHDLISNVLFDYFNIFGAIWLIKTSVSILLPVAVALVLFFLIGYWMGFGLIIHDNRHTDNCKTIGYCLLWMMFAPICAILCAFCAALAAEVLCFGLIAVFVFAVSTDRMRHYNTTEVGDIISFILHFIRHTNKGKHDRIIRILAVNWALFKGGMNKNIGSYIENNVNYDAITQITYRDIRKNSASPLKANLPKDIITSIIREFTNLKLEAYAQTVYTFDSYWEWQFVILYVLIFVIAFPIYLVSKVVQVLYPWFILGYLCVFQLTKQIDVFQLTMLAIYILLQLVLLFMGIYVLQLHWWLWHVSPGTRGVYLRRVKISVLEKHVYEFYDGMVWFPKTKGIVLSCLGDDIGNIVMEYVKLTFLDEIIKK